MLAASNGSDARGIKCTLSDFSAGTGWLPWLFLSLHWKQSPVRIFACFSSQICKYVGKEEKKNI